jgi:serine/threonine protein kinase/Tfp pilus assembly protein PilF
VKCPNCQFDNPDETLYCGKCGTRFSAPVQGSPSVSRTLEAPLRRLKIGSIFAERYEIIEELGKGGMGEVYRVRDLKLDEEMAFKVLKPEIAAHKEIIERFKNELKFARKIAHRNVCKMYDLNEQDGTLYITMEYVKGEDLKGFLGRKGPLSKEDTLAIARQVGEGLAEAHALGVIHRDLKPQNIMIDEKGQAKIMDFGIARSIEAPGMTQTGMMIGTPDYISPEQAEGGTADQRSDIYSLGVILYEMATGRVPFKGDTALSVALKHKTQMPPDPRKLNAGLSEDLSRLILRCMEKDAGGRYQTAKELLADLDRIEKGLPITKAAILKKKRAIRWKRILSYAGAAGLLIVLIAAVLLLIKPRIHSLAVLPFRNLTGDPGQDYFVDEIADEMIGHLGRIQALRVISFYSVMPYKDGKTPLATIARDLNVDALVEGAVQQVGDNLNLRVRLIKTRPEERNLWENTYSRSITDTLIMYADVARAISQKINVKLTPQQESRFAGAARVNPETYKAYLRGTYYLNFGSTDEDFKKGMDYLRQAVEKDPADPLAYIGLANGYVTLGHSPAAPPDAWQQARAAAERALKLDENFADGYAIIADVKLYHERDWKGAELNFRRAMELNPNLPWNHYHYAWYLALFNRWEEAIREHKRAQELDPLTPTHTGWLGGLYWYTGQYDKALEEAQKCLKLKEGYALGWFIIGNAYAARGMYKEAIEAHKNAVKGDARWKYGLGRSYALAGQMDEARKILAELEKEPPSPFGAWGLAIMYATLGENDKAFKSLEYQPAHAWIPWFRVDPEFIPLRNDPRFKELLRKYDLPDVK